MSRRRRMTGAADAATTDRRCRRACDDDSCSHVAAAPASNDVERQHLNRRVRLLVATTISYNVIEAVIAISAGAIAGSTALIGFGLDSVIEVSPPQRSSHGSSPGRDPEARERTALRVIAVLVLRPRRLRLDRVVRALVGIGGR